MKLAYTSFVLGPAQLPNEVFTTICWSKKMNAKLRCTNSQNESPKAPPIAQ